MRDEILRLLQGPRSLSTISSRLRIPRWDLFNLLVKLEDEGLVTVVNGEWVAREPLDGQRANWRETAARNAARKFREEEGHEVVTLQP